MIINKTRQLRRLPVVLAAAALASAAGLSANDAVAGEHSTSASSEATVVGLRQAGWVVTERQERIERRPGLPPYEMLERTIHITTFVLQKNGRRKRCRLDYDSQLEVFDQECRDAE